jgi:transposase
VAREGIRVREITKEEGQRLLRIVRPSSGSVVTWRRAQMVLLPAQGMDVAQIAKVAFTSEDRVRAVLHNLNDDAFESLYPKYGGGRPPTFTLPQRQAIKKIALARPQDHDLPFSTWSLRKLAGFLVAEGVLDDVSHEAFGSCSERRACRFKLSRRSGRATTPTTRPRRTGSSSSTTSPTAKPHPALAIRRSCPAWMSSGRSTCNPTPARSGSRRPPAKATQQHPAGVAVGRPTPVPTVSGTCSPPTTWAGTGSTATSRSATAAPSPSPSAATSGR